MKHIDENIGDDISLSDSLKKGIDRFMSIKENSTFRFGVIVSTYRRKDGTTPDRLMEAIESISNQRYKNFKIYLMGDDYENESEIKGIVESVDHDKISYENLELPGERLMLEGHDLWHSGSNFAANIAIDKANRDGITHMVRLDHDDVWTPDHLQIIAKALTKWKDAKFISTTALIKRFKQDTTSYTRPAEGSIKSIRYNNLKHLTDVWHSALCWDIKEFKELRYRNVREQKLTEPVRAECRGGDRDLIERIKYYCESNEKKWISLPMVTMLYRNKRGELPDLNEYLEEKMLLD